MSSHQTSNLTGGPVANAPVVWTGWCDFPYCASSCWRRCTAMTPRWDGALTYFWRETWRALLGMSKRERQRFLMKPTPPAKQPMQLELV